MSRYLKYFILQIILFQWYIKTHALKVWSDSGSMASDLANLMNAELKEAFDAFDKVSVTQG